MPGHDRLRVSGPSAVNRPFDVASWEHPVVAVRGGLFARGIGRSHRSFLRMKRNHSVRLRSHDRNFAYSSRPYEYLARISKMPASRPCGQSAHIPTPASEGTLALPLFRARPPTGLQVDRPVGRPIDEPRPLHVTNRRSPFASRQLCTMAGTRQRIA